MVVRQFRVDGYRIGSKLVGIAGPASRRPSPLRILQESMPIGRLRRRFGAAN
jgi:hypothetical protein